MRLGFDLDGTVADMHAALTAEARRLFPDIDPAAVPNSAAPGEPGSAAPPTDEQRLSIGSLSPKQQREMGTAGQKDQLPPVLLYEAVQARERAGFNLGERLPEVLARAHRRPHFALLFRRK